VRCAGHVARLEIKNAYTIIVEKPEGKRPLGRYSRRWEDRIKMGLREVSFEDATWIHMAQERTNCGLL
jgi:hypothetical protein